MGATFTAAGLHGTTAYFAQVGDSRAYVVRGGQAQQITRDQSLVGQLVEAGHITQEEAERHSYKNVILQALGAAPSINVVVDSVPLQDMDILVLCSDGLSNKVRAEEITDEVDRAKSLKEACDSLIGLANERGGEDNITVVVAQLSGGKLRSSVANNLDATIPLASHAPAQDRWGAETIPRDPELPYEIDEVLLDDEEETIPPTAHLDS
jgi:protein phosphatase